MELKREEHERALELKRFEVKESGKDFVVSRNIKFVLPFNRNHVNKYFQHFEKVTTSLNWPKTLWSIIFAKYSLWEGSTCLFFFVCQGLC